MKVELTNEILMLICLLIVSPFILLYIIIDIYYPDYLKLLEGLFFTLGIFVISKLFWMVYYEWRYSKGEEYLERGKKSIKD